MNVLLDTHSFLWFIAGDVRLSAPAQALIEAPENDLFLSMASVWEIAIKYSLGKLTLAQPFGDVISAQIDANGINLLPLEVAHTVQVTALPFHHRDPFDRMIVAQALVENLPVISVDPALDLYGIKRLW
jgi:PIN domain nuclease of toxin-antitoxin system